MEFTVELFVYDLSQGLASSLSLQFVGKQFDGIWHTGISCYGYEYFFGGGIQKMFPKTTPYGLPVKTHLLGKTKKSQAEFEHWLGQQRNRFSVTTYNLMTNNCNNFTNACSQFLLGGVSIPDYILNLPMEFFETPVGQMMRSYFDNMMGGGHLNIDNTSQQWLSSQQQPKLQPQSGTTEAKSNSTGTSRLTSSSPFHDNEKFYRFMMATNTSAILKKLKQFISPIVEDDNCSIDVKKRLKEIVTGTLDEYAVNKRALDQKYLKEFFDEFSFLFQVLS